MDVASIGPHSTSLQRAKVVERANVLQRKLDAWFEIQHLYVPSIALLRARADAAGGSKPISVENMELYLPSSVVQTITMDKYLLEYEWQLRYSHAEGALNELRGLLLMRSLVYKSKDRYSRGQRQNTRSQALIHRVEGKIQFVASKYRHIRSAMVHLADHVLEFNWENVIRELKDSDIAGLTSTDDNFNSEGRKKLTWIWKVHGMDLGSDENTQAGGSAVNLSNYQFIDEVVFGTFNSTSYRMVSSPGPSAQVARRMSASARRNGTRPSFLHLERGKLAQSRIEILGTAVD